MKKLFFKFQTLLLIAGFTSCTNDSENIFYDETAIQLNETISDSSSRLHFENVDELIDAINSPDTPNGSPNRRPPGAIEANIFISLMAKDITKSNQIPQPTYYESLGYEDLIPNVNFARLFNTKGELEIGDEVIRVTSKGTYVFKTNKEKEFNL